MKNTFYYLLVAVVFSLCSCGDAAPKEKTTTTETPAEKQYYTSELIGWTIEIPSGWNVENKTEEDILNGKGKEAIEEAIEEELDVNGLHSLLFLKKNMFNQFQSTAQSFDPIINGSWEANNEFQKETIAKTFEQQGIKVDMGPDAIEQIDGLDFKTFSITLYGPQGNVILNQMMFARYINGYDFGMNISYNNEVDRDELLRIIRASKFTIKES